ncbi:MAG: sensor domain-containing diguanylate cyclase [Gammaproteobacteria bacterium]|nr:sensor domain-containing diguanylate cyclase [Gammaproteobacteria bacterium]
MFPDDKILDRIFMISERMVIFDGLDDVFEHIVKTATTLTLAEAATIRVFDIETGLLDIVKGYGVTEGFLTQPPIRVGEGITGTVVQTRQPIKTTNVQNNPLCKNSELATLEGIHSAICVPMNNRDSSIGCITVYRKSSTAFSDHELMLLSIFAAEAVQAVEKAQLLAELKSQATQDPLTGLWNKKAFLNKLAVEVDRCRRHKQSLATLFIDLDGFKTFNDTHGHLMGDKLLHDFTGILKQHCRKIDVIGRFGGDEFVVIAPQTDVTGALNLAEKLRKATAEFSFLGSHIDEDAQITCSIGVAILQDGFDVEQILADADKALYTSKNNGRNQVTIFNDELTPVAI